jgi:hypothetical protein
VLLAAAYHCSRMESWCSIFQPSSRPDLRNYNKHGQIESHYGVWFRLCEKPHNIHATCIRREAPRTVRHRSQPPTPLTVKTKCLAGMGSKVHSQPNQTCQGLAPALRARPLLCRGMQLIIIPFYK